MSGHVPSVVTHLVPNGRLAASNRLDLAIGLPLRDQTGLSKLLRGLYDPSSTNYHRYLTPGEFTTRFGPTVQDYETLLQFAKKNELTVTHTHGNRVLLDVNGKVSDIEKAFHITLRTYPHPTEARNFFAPDTEPSVDEGVPVLDISGLSDYGKPKPSLHPIPAGTKAKPAVGSGPGGAFMGLDFRNAYAPGVTLDGTGQMVGLFQLTGYDPNDIFAYEAQAGLPNVYLQNVLVDGADGSAGNGEDEACLDIEMSISMATNLASVVVFEGPNNNNMAIWNDVLNTMASSNQIKQFSCSWGAPGSPSQTTDQIFQQMAAQGQSFFQASGDGDAWTSPIWEPAESPYITVVGGTTLTMNGRGVAYRSEQVWNWGDIGMPWGGGLNGATNNYWGSGGGVSGNYAMPYWQTNVDMTTNLGSTTMRNIPDVAMTADNVYVTYGSGTNGAFGGTSCAAPLWAGFMALVNQQAMSMNNPPIGFLNPAIYALGCSTNYSACFNDITNGDNTWPGSTNEYFAVPGYDLCTGWGTPAGTNLINALAGLPDQLVITPMVGFAAIGAVAGPFSGTAQTFSLYNNGANALNWSLINTSTWFNVSAGAGTLMPGAQINVTVSLASAANLLPPGDFSAVILFTNQTTQIAQPINFALQIGQSLVQDGGFESGTFSRWMLAGNTISGSTVFDAVESSLDFSMVAHSGNFGAFLGDSQMAYLSQNLPTCPGQTYLFSFWLDNPSSGSGQQFQASWNTNAVSTNTVFSLVSPVAFTWTNLNFVLTAGDTNTTIQFGAENPPNYFGLDDVSVIPVPTPNFSSAVQTAGGLQLTWNTLANVSYVVQYTTNLSQPSWLPLGPSIMASTDTLSTIDTNSVGGFSQCFYRVTISP